MRKKIVIETKTEEIDVSLALYVDKTETENLVVYDKIELFGKVAHAVNLNFGKTKIGNRCAWVTLGVSNPKYFYSLAEINEFLKRIFPTRLILYNLNIKSSVHEPTRKNKPHNIGGGIKLLDYAYADKGARETL